MRYFLSKRQLTAMIKEQLGRYNMQHPEEKMDAEGLFQRADHFYYRDKHPDRYTILWKWLEPEVQEEPAFIAKLRNTYKRKTTPKKDPQKPESDSCIPLDREEIERYMDGTCLLFDEWREDGSTKPAGDPSRQFYLLARASGMPESDMIRAFYEGDGLDVLRYDSYCAYDVFEYYLKKSGLTNTGLSGRIIVKGYKTSTIAKLLNRSENITYDQFAVLAEALGIPDKWTKFCLYRLTQKKDRLPYKLGYQSWENDFMENPDGAVTSLHSWTDIAGSKRYGTVSRLYRQMGYTLLSDAFPEQADTGDRDAMGRISLEVMKPDRSMHSLPLAEYETVIKKVLAFARSCLESRLGQDNTAVCAGTHRIRKGSGAMKPYLSRKQLSLLLQKQVCHYIHHHPEESWAENRTSLFIMANNLYDRKSADRHRILQDWLEPGTAVDKTGNECPVCHNIYSDIMLEEKDINSFLSGNYLTGAEYSQLPVQDRKGKTMIRRPGLLFYLLARLTEMEEPDIISAFHAGEGLELSEYETYCAYDVFEYYFQKTWSSAEKFCHSLAQEGIEGFKSSTVSKLLLRGTGIAKNDNEFIAVGDDITLEQFSKLAGILQIPDKWKNFCLCRLAHKEDPFTCREGYLDSLEDGTEEPEYLVSLLRQKGREEQGDIPKTVSQLYDQLGYTVLGLPPSWTEADSSGTAVLKIKNPAKGNSSNDAGRNVEKGQGENMYKMDLDSYRAVLEDVASYARSALEDILRQNENG